MEADRRAANGERAFCAPFRTFIGHHDDRTTDLEFRMGDFAIRPRQTHPLGGAEHIFVKLNRFGRALHD